MPFINGIILKFKNRNNMIKRFKILGVIILLGLGLHFSASAQNTVMSHADSLNHTLDVYYELNRVIFQADSKPDDIDSLFSYFTDDFTYVHPKYGGVYTREDLYNGYLNNQEKGDYDGSVAGYQITNKIVGLNAITVSRHYLRKEDNRIIEGENQMTLFEFRQGKISRIYEYW